MCDNNDIKTKRKNYNVRVYTNFKHNRIPKDNEYSVCLSVTVLNSIFVNLDKKILSSNILRRMQICDKRLKKILNTINENLELSESDEISDK